MNITQKSNFFFIFTCDELMLEATWNDQFEVQQLLVVSFICCSLMCSFINRADGIVMIDIRLVSNFIYYMSFFRFPKYVVHFI